MQNNIRIEHVGFRYEKNKDVLKDITIKIQENKITTLIGSNGCGKSTMLLLIANLLKLNEGSIYLGEQEITSLKRKEFAKQLAIVHQQNTAPEDISVRELVAYGRIPYQGIQMTLSKKDEEMIDWAIEICDLDHIETSNFSNLSGGQKQRVWIAMALAQDTPILLLDEPTTYLDARYQIEILQLIKDLNTKYDKTIVMVLHDINQAIHYSDEVVMFEKGTGRIYQGKPLDVITKESLLKVYEKELKLIHSSEGLIVLNV